MLASMSATDWSELAVSGLPTGTVTLLWQTSRARRGCGRRSRRDVGGDCVAGTTLAGLIAAHDGVRPVEQGEGDSFVLAFARASDAVACALALQRAPLAPIRLRIGINTGEIQLRDEGNYIGPTINRTARLRDLAHGGHTVLSGATEPMVVDQLPDDAWPLTGQHPLRDLPRPERVVQLCHPDICQRFPAATGPKLVRARSSGALTSFVGRDAQIADLRQVGTRQPAGDITGAAVRVRPACCRVCRYRRTNSATASGMWTWHRSPFPIWYRLRAFPRTRACRSTGPLHDGHDRPVSVSAGCCWCWTTASICSMPAPR